MVMVVGGGDTKIMPDTSRSIGEHQPPDTYFPFYGKNYLVVLNLF